MRYYLKPRLHCSYNKSGFWTDCQILYPAKADVSALIRTLGGKKMSWRKLVGIPGKVLTFELPDVSTREGMLSHKLEDEHELRYYTTILQFLG